ncbi:MAG: glycosyltransferase [Opitutales bacterium]|nr:glycosyltransferase [Opitutales bacterium]
MRIVYVSREFGPITGGGIGTYISNVCRAMLERGHEVFLLTNCVNDENRHHLPDGLKLIDLPPVPEVIQGGFFSYNNEYAHRVYEGLKELENKGGFDVAEFAEYCGEGFIAIRAKRLFNEFVNSKLIVKCHTPLSFLDKINEEYLFYAENECDIAMEDYCIKHADQVTSPSQSLADYFEKRIARKDIKICPYPLYLNFSDQEKEWTPKLAKVVRFLGSVQVRKGVDVFIDAAVEVLKNDPEFIFEIYGKERSAQFFNQSLTDILKKRIPPGFEDRILFKGGVEYAQVSQVLHETGICILPSRWENWANACLESMAMGCVVMASSSGGMAEMIEDGTSGYHIDPLDPQKLAEKILKVSSNLENLKTVSARAIERAKELTEPLPIVQRIESNYNSATSEKTSDWKQTNRPSVSVVIPYYNQSDTLLETLNSVEQSTYPNIEIVIVNDGSPCPASKAVFEQLDDEKYTKILKPNGGLSSARNAGINTARGDYILPLDSDDTIHPEYIAKAVTALENNPELGYVSCYTKNFGAFTTAYVPIGYVDLLMPFMNTHGKCTNLFRKKVMQEVGGYDENMNSYEDWDFLLTLDDAGVENDVLPEVLFYYRRSFGSMVFSVANAARANLIQYMMHKHEKDWSLQGPKMAKILARLWKDAEMRDEKAISERFQVYWAVDGAFSEETSAVQSFIPPAKGNVHAVLFEQKLPFENRPNTLRIDPCATAMEMEIEFVRVLDLNSGEILFNSDATNAFDNITIAGTAKRGEIEEGFLKISSTGKDPQILLSHPEMIEKYCKVQISMKIYKDEG